MNLASYVIIITASLNGQLMCDRDGIGLNGQLMCDRDGIDTDRDMQTFSFSLIMLLCN